MDLELFPLLQVQRELYAMPRNMDRFNAYLKHMIGSSEDDIEFPPLVMMNPMGREHCLEAVDHLIAIGAEDAAGQALVEARARLVDVAGAFKVSLILADDRMGGWTNRMFAGFTARFPTRDALTKRPFITVPCWTSETWTTEDARRQTLAQVRRVAFVMQHGTPQTLRERMAQEGEARAFAGLTLITLPSDELSYSREVIAPHLDATDQPTVFACLFGDEAANEAGYPQLGLPKNAGIEVALSQVMGKQ
jgi:hypothetical protein